MYPQQACSKLVNTFSGVTLLLLTTCPQGKLDMKITVVALNTIHCHQTRLLARRASRHPGTPLEQKMDAFGRPNSGEKINYFQ
jgi:hypothetical protein